MAIKSVSGKTYQLETGCGKIYVTINNDEKDNPTELFCRIGKAGGCSSSQTEAVGRLATLALKHGISPVKVIKQLQSISCHRPHNDIASCSDAVAAALANHVQID